MICIKRNVLNQKEEKIGESIWLFCPGCETAHQLYVQHTDPKAPVWKWNNDLQKPTFSPSLLVTIKYGEPGKPSTVCHSFIKEGQIQFLGDCYHKLKGQTVPLPELPEWLR